MAAESFGRMLVPIDFSPASRQALRQAVHFQLNDDELITVLHVIPPPEPGHSLSPHLLNELKQTLEKFATVSAPTGYFAYQIEIGDPAAHIVIEAGQGNYDLLVLGASGLAKQSHLRLGAVAEYVVQHAPCAVLAVDADLRDEEPSIRWLPRAQAGGIARTDIPFESAPRSLSAIDALHVVCPETGDEKRAAECLRCEKCMSALLAPGAGYFELTCRVSKS